MISREDTELVPEVLKFWDRLEAAQKRIVLNNMSTVTYKKGTTIHSGENDCIGVLLIKTGELRVYILSEEGKEITLFRLRDKEICVLSASCILDNITFEVHIDAEQDTEVLLIPSNLYRELCDTNMYAENFSDKIIIEHFSDVMWAMEQILFMSFDKRLAIFLFDEVTRTGMDVVELTHEQIAKYIGSAREVVSRMLKYFAGESLVELSRGGVKILDKKRLRELTY